MAKKSKEEHKTLKGVFDIFTEQTLFKLMSQGYFEGLKSPISIGKEAHVFSAETKEKKLLAIKIYRLETCDFNRMYDYIKDDPRYGNLKKNKRKIIFAWAQREFRNLMKAREAGVRCPLPIAFSNNVLVIEFIGGNEAAPRLKDSVVRHKKKFFDEVVESMRRLYHAGLVHGDLSAFNILNFNDKPYLIDFSQGTPVKNPNSIGLLDRDIKNVCGYFRKIGLAVNDEKTKEKILTNS